MIIVSPDKEKIVRFNNKININYDCTYDTILKKTEKFWIIFIDGEDMAHYKTEERAKEVLQELINRIVLTERFEAICIPERQDNMVIDMYDNDRPLFIYKMPEE